MLLVGSLVEIFLNYSLIFLVKHFFYYDLRIKAICLRASLPETESNPLDLSKQEKPRDVFATVEKFLKIFMLFSLNLGKILMIKQ